MGGPKFEGRSDSQSLEDDASTTIGPGQLHSSTACRPFLVALSRKGDQWRHIGITVHPDYRMATLLVDKVWSPSLISNWNDQNPKMKVCVGDSIGSVNGVSDSAENMIVELSR